MNEIHYSDAGFSAEEFLALAQRVWPRNYDRIRAAAALERTVNVGAWDDARLVGAVRVLSDGYFFATVPEILVDPEYQRRGIGRVLMGRALDHAPRAKLFLGAQASAVGFFERLGCRPGPVGLVFERRPADATELTSQQTRAPLIGAASGRTLIGALAAQLNVRQQAMYVVRDHGMAVRDGFDRRTGRPQRLGAESENESPGSSAPAC